MIAGLGSTNKLSDQLATVPDNMLPRMAQQYKQDAITLSMILSEKNRRDRIRQSGTMQAQPQPKVNDAVVASMQPQMQQMPQGQAQAMPEDTGIAQLPAGNMNFADGGIISFADGGEVQRFAGEGASLVRSTTGGRDYFLDIPKMVRDPSVSYYRLIPNPTAELAGKKFGSRQEAAQAYDALTSPAPSPTGPPMTAAQPATQTYTRTGGNPGGGANTAQPPAPGADTAFGAQTPPGALPPGAQRPAGIAQLAAPPARSFMERYEASGKDRTVTDPYADQETALQTEETAAAKRRISELDADTASRGDAYAGRKERVDKREGELEKSRATNEGMAFLEAGLAMMQSKGRGLAGIAQGAGVGVKAYGTGIEKLKLAQEKLDEARDKIDSAQDTENQLTKRERRGLLADADKTATQGKRAYLSATRALLSEDEALRQKAAASDVATENSQAQIASAERIAKAAANRAVLADVRAVDSKRLGAATALVKAAQVTLKDISSTPDDIATAKRDYETGMAALRMTDFSSAEKATVAKYLK